jgi:hypothetical protein
MINHSGNEKGPHEQSLGSSAESWSMAERLNQSPRRMDTLI